MAEYPQLPGAPIVEALVDLRVRLSDDFDVSTLAGLHDSLREQYPRKETQHLIAGRVHFSSKGIVSEDQERSIRGFRMLSDDGKNIVQFRRDGFTFSRLHPYTGWAVLFGEAWRLWQLYSATTQHPPISRLATRFINRLQLPSEFKLEEYFRAAPDVPEGIPDVLAGFLYKYILAPTDGLMANVTLATEPATPGEVYTSVVFDVDCYAQTDFSADDEAEIRAYFDRLHDLKNLIFFNSLTESAIESFR